MKKSKYIVLFGIFVFSVFFVVSTSHATSPNYDTISSCGTDYGNSHPTAQCTYAHNTTTTAARVAVGIIAIGSESATNPPPTGTAGAMTYNGTAMTQIGCVTSPAGGPTLGVYTETYICAYKLDNPATGSNNVVANYTYSGAQTEAWWSAFATFSNVNTTSSIPAYATSTANNGIVSSTITAVNSDSILIDFSGFSSRNEGSPSGTPGAGQTEKLEIGTGSGSSMLLTSSIKTISVSGPNSMSYSASSGEGHSDSQWILEVAGVPSPEAESGSPRQIKGIGVSR